MIVIPIVTIIYAVPYLGTTVIAIRAMSPQLNRTVIPTTDSLAPADHGVDWSGLEWIDVGWIGVGWIAWDLNGITIYQP